MTEVYVRVMSEEPWRKTAWLKDSEAERMARDLRARGLKVAMVKLRDK